MCLTFFETGKGKVQDFLACRSSSSRSILRIFIGKSIKNKKILESFQDIESNLINLTAIKPFLGLALRATI